MSNQLEEDVQRVLELARAQALTRHPQRQAKLKPGQNLHRHRHDVDQRRCHKPTLVASKTQALMAIYGLEKNAKDAAALRPGDGKVAVSEEDPVVLKRRLDSRRELYKLHYSGGLKATCQSTGLPKLESLLEAARHAKDSSSRHAAVGFGAAVLTSNHRIYAASTVENVQDERYSVCAEHAALLKMATVASNNEDEELVEAMAICSDQSGSLPYPCGRCREFMAMFGDFPVYLLNRDGKTEETTSSALFPGARHAELAQTVMARPRQDVATIERVAKTNSSEPPIDLKDWGTDHVAQWVVKDVELPQYKAVFVRNQVDGCVLSHLEDCDLQLLLGITHPLHRKRLLVHLDRLRDRELLSHGIDYGQLQDYLAVLDRDRIAVVAQLKSTFDRLDINNDGFLDVRQVHQALITAESIGSSVAGVSIQRVEQLLHDEVLFGSDAKDGKVSFPAFAIAFSMLAMKPAAEDRATGLTNSSKTPPLDPLPVLDLNGLRTSFAKVDTNGSREIDEKELVALFQSLGHDQRVAKCKAGEWFKSADLDGDAKLSFPEFLIRYIQLTNVDITRLRQLFEESEPLASTRLKPRATVSRALVALFPNLTKEAIASWVDAYFSEDKLKTTVSFAEFLLACFSFAPHGRKCREQATALKKVVRNDALAHRSRIVQLQQSGHVRLCPQSEELSELRRQDVAAQRQQLEKLRRERDERRKRQEQEVEEDDKDETVSDKRRQEREREINSAFARFAKCRSHGKRLSNHNRKTAQESKDASESEEQEDDEEMELTAAEAAQAALELGIALSREQIVRFLQSQGFDLRRRVSRGEFRRVMAQLDAECRSARRSGKAGRAGWKYEPIVKATTKADVAKAKWYGAHSSQQEYDEFLKHRQRKMRDQMLAMKDTSAKLKDRKSWSREMRRVANRRRDESDSKGNSSSESHDSDSTQSSSSRGHHRHQHRSSHHHKQSKRSSRHRSRYHHHRNNSDTDTGASDSSSDREAVDKIRVHRRGLQVGDRIRHKTSGACGTIFRLYRDYFVADVQFDSGKRTKNVDLGSLRRLSDQDEAAQNQWLRRLAKQWKIGTLVNVQHKGTKSVRKGKIVLCRMDNTFDVLVDEFGEAETLKRLPLTRLRPVQRRQPAFFTVGASVTVKQRAEYLRGTVHVCRTDGTYDVRLRKDRKVLTSVVAELLSLDDNSDGDGGSDEEPESRTAKRKETREQDSDSEDDRKPKRDEPKRSEDDFEPEFDKGDCVEARFNGGSAYFPGRIARVYTDDTYDIVYDDGDEESRVPSRLVRSTTKAAPAPSATKISKESDYDEDLFESD